MTDHPYTSIGDVVEDTLFPDVDLALRDGRHIDRDDGDRYAFLIDAQSLLESFYRRFGCELVRATDGYFYLVPSGDRLGRRQLSPGEMLVGQTLALLYLDPATVQAAGAVARSQIVETLASLVGEDKLVSSLNPRRKRRDQKVEHEVVRQELDRSLRALARLGFTDLIDEEQVRLRPPVMRFADPVRGLGDVREALERLAQRGEVELEAVAGGADDALSDPAAETDDEGAQ